MKDKEGNIIYVGKAKSLKNRVRSYFQNSRELPMRTKVLVDQITDLEWIEVGSDLEALFLETNLIKEYRPKYNILMKDDKNYVYLKITKNEDFPRVEIVRKVEKDGAKYIGPKTAAYKVENTLKMLQKIFNFRSCNLGIKFVQIGDAEITNKTIAYPCLDYHIKRCEAPCIGKVSPEDYRENIRQIENFFEGKTDEIEKKLTADMDRYAREKNFEMAVKIRDKLFTIRDLKQKQIVTSPDHRNADIFGFVIENEKAYMNLFLIRDGKLLDHENFIIDAPGYETAAAEDACEVMESFLFQYYQKTTDFPEEIIIPCDLDEYELFEEWIRNQAEKKVVILRPQKGIKYQLLELALKNAESFRKQNKARWEVAEEKDINAMKELQRVLSLEKLPKRIECYDISHLSGTNTVASMVVFADGKPKKSDYRKFRIRELEHGQIDDFKSMAEVLGRRLSRLAKGNSKVEIKKATKSSIKEIDRLFKEKGAKPLGEYKNFYLAYAKGKAVGKIRVIEVNKVFMLENFYVSPKFRFQGIGSTLLKYAIEKTPSNRIYIICKSELKNFYEANGFDEIKKLPDEISFKLEEYTEQFGDSDRMFFAYDKLKHIDESFDAKPDLIVIDGGKGQLSAVYKVMRDLDLRIPLISLAKREEEVFVPGKSRSLIIPKNNEALYLLQRIRDEAHRFAITFQKNSRKKDLISSALDKIEGIGDKTKMKLLSHFGSVEVIKKAGKEEIAALTSEKIAEKIIKELI